MKRLLFIPILSMLLMGAQCGRMTSEEVAYKTLNTASLGLDVAWARYSENVQAQRISGPDRRQFERQYNQARAAIKQAAILARDLVAAGQDVPTPEATRQLVVDVVALLTTIIPPKGT